MLKCLVPAACLLASAALAGDTAPWLTIPAAPAMPPSTQSAAAPINGIEMHYALFGPELSGSEPQTPVLLIHGGLAHGDIWSAQVAELMQDHPVITADTRGHGRSTNDGSAYSYDLLAADYLALLDYLGVAQVHLVGWSDGANIGYTLSIAAPERLASHFAHAGNVTLAGIDPKVETNEVFGTYVGMMAEDYSQMSPTPDGFEDFFAGVVEMWGTDKPGGMEALADVTVPTLVVQSQYDEAILTEHAEEIAATIPGAELLVLDDTSHFAVFQAPAAYTAAIREFIE